MKSRSTMLFFTILFSISIHAKSEIKKEVKKYKAVVLVAEVDSPDAPVRLEYNFDNKLSSVDLRNGKKKGITESKSQQVPLKSSNMICETYFTKSGGALSLALRCSSITEDITRKEKIGNLTMLEIESDCDKENNTRNLRLASYSSGRKSNSNYYIFISCQNQDE